MTVGDINSRERGSGARYNDGKPHVEYVPARVLADFYGWRWIKDDAEDPAAVERVIAVDTLYRIAQFEEGDDDALLEALQKLEGLATFDIWQGAGAQFDCGARKYAAWNWARGMKWSIPLACIKRHLVKVLRCESIDEESGVHHFGAVACNLVMLIHFVVHFREGDDRPPAECFNEPRKNTDAYLLEQHLSRLPPNLVRCYVPKVNALHEGNYIVEEHQPGELITLESREPLETRESLLRSLVDASAHD
jgi:hypothetical protein